MRVVIVSKALLKKECETPFPALFILHALFHVEPKRRRQRYNADDVLAGENFAEFRRT